jgi:NAD-dependent deacetylase
MNVYDQHLEEAARLIEESERVVALTGAGMSVESGIPAFRGVQGLWARYDPAEYACIDAFLAEPEKVWAMLLELHTLLEQARPNPGHVALAEMERLGYLTEVITQNIDHLHQDAGSRCVIEFHGSSRRMACLGCAELVPSDQVDLSSIPPYCPCGGLLKPDVIFFGELIPPATLSQAREASRSSSVMMVIGTSASVAPACDMPLMTKEEGGKIIEINTGETPLTHTITDIFLQGPAGEILPRLVKLLEAKT